MNISSFWFCVSELNLFLVMLWLCARLGLMFCCHFGQEILNIWNVSGCRKWIISIFLLSEDIMLRRFDGCTDNIFLYIYLCNKEPKISEMNLGPQMSVILMNVVISDFHWTGCVFLFFHDNMKIICRPTLNVFQLVCIELKLCPYKVIEWIFVWNLVRIQILFIQEWICIGYHIE